MSKTKLHVAYIQQSCYNMEYNKRDMVIMAYGAITNFDFSILIYIYENLRNDFLDFLMPMLSILGEGGMIWFAISIIMLLFKKTRVCAIAMMLSMALSFLTGEIVLKNIFCRERPCHYAQYSYIQMLVARPISYSFPSGHTSSSFSAAVAMFMYNKKAGIFAIVLAFLIGFSRLYNFVHFPTDVFFGMLLGIASAILVVWLIKKYKFDDKINKLSSKSHNS